MKEASMEAQSFAQDCRVLAHELHRRGRLSRRQLGGALAALAAVGVAGPARAQAKELVMVNWGGLANQGFGDSYGKPFEAANPGVKVVQDSTGPSAGRIMSMVQSGKVTWDLCDSSTSSSILLGRQKLVEPINYGIVNKADVIDSSFALEFGAAPYSFSSVLIYDSAKFPQPPTGWKDFWDLGRFPGTRLLRRDPTTTLDAAAVSLGADPKTMYPLAEKEVLKRVGDIRKNCVWWTNGSESEQFMRTGEAVMGCIWHTRATVLERESKGRLKFIWDQGMLQAGIMVIPKNNPGGELAQRLLASSLANAAPQVELLKLLGNGPTNPRAAALVPDDLRKYNPTDPANAAKQFVMSGQWWGDNYTRLNQDLLDVITG
jgi:putative spermidine/putrescine transport system substrate-binding protein